VRNAMLTLKTTLKTATSGTVGSILKPALFAVLMWTASAAGAVPIPGTPVPITLQTFVVMLAALMLITFIPEISLLLPRLFIH
jgi:biotin transport system substrate-specific component